LGLRVGATLLAVRNAANNFSRSQVNFMGIEGLSIHRDGRDAG